MQPVAWLGFAVGIGLLLITGSSVIKMLLIPRNLGSAITTTTARGQPGRRHRGEPGSCG